MTKIEIGSAKDPKWTGWTRYNGGQKCDMDDGPCACGAWHSKDEEHVQKMPIWMHTFGEDRAPQETEDTENP